MGVYNSRLSVGDIDREKLGEILDSMRLFSECNEISKLRAIESFLSMLGMKKYIRDSRRVRISNLGVEIVDTINMRDVLYAYKLFLSFDGYTVHIKGSILKDTIILYRMDGYEEKVELDVIILMLALFILENCNESYKDFSSMISTGVGDNPKVREFYGIFIKPFYGNVHNKYSFVNIANSSKGKSTMENTILCFDCIHREVCKYYEDVKNIDRSIFNISCKFKG